MLKDGEEGGRAGRTICCEVRREAVPDVRRGDEARGLGDGGTEFRSGAILTDQFVAGSTMLTLAWSQTKKSSNRLLARSFLLGFAGNRCQCSVALTR